MVDLYGNTPSWVTVQENYESAVITPTPSTVAAPPIVTTAPPSLAPAPAYNPPVITKIGIVKAGPVATPILSTVTVDSLLAAPASAGAASESVNPASVPAMQLTQSTSLEGGANSPSITPDPNSPGLASNFTIGGFTVSKHWMWIILIVAALAALWYFYGSSVTAAA